MPTKILVVGGAGFIGSHMVDMLSRNNFIPIVLDNLSTGHRQAVKNAELIVGDMGDGQLVESLFAAHEIKAVMHFAAHIQVDESVKNPAKYYQNNVTNTLQLLQAMIKNRIPHFIFSSSASVYGEPQYFPIDEKHPLMPINPYGRCKLIVEMMLEDFAAAYDFNFIALRYFNAAGADPEGKLQECHDPETHLIPLVLKVANGELPAIKIFGRDYPTVDGTCVRDYVHVSDICRAHLQALQALFAGKKRAFYNLGNGKGFSVRQVVETAKVITQKNIPIIYDERRLGDPALLVAEASLARQELNWHPRYQDLSTIISHAWQSFALKNFVISN
jgi:UDP-glucose 4-epimerase